MDVEKLMVVALAGWINRQQVALLETGGPISFGNTTRDRNHQGLESRIIEPEFGLVEKGR